MEGCIRDPVGRVGGKMQESSKERDFVMGVGYLGVREIPGAKETPRHPQG